MKVKDIRRILQEIPNDESEIYITLCDSIDPKALKFRIGGIVYPTAQEPDWSIIGF